MTNTPHGIERTSWKAVTQCRAKAKGSGQRCNRPARANGVCYIHGGASPAGLAHPSTKTGRYSKHLPTRLLAQFGASLVDPDLLNLRSEIALVDTSIADVIGQHDDPAEFPRSIAPLVEQRRRLVDSERVRLKDMAQMMTVEEAMMLVNVVYAAVARHVHNTAARAAIGADLARILADETGIGGTVPHDA